MKIGNLFSNYSNPMTIVNKGTEKNNSLPVSADTSKERPVRSDSLTISQAGYNAQMKLDNISAYSGKDKLGISRGKTENSYIVHFDNYALVNRAVSRGVITVNGVDVQLSDEVKERLVKTSEEAFKANEAATMRYAAEHNSIVAKQQAEVMSSINEKMSKAMSIMSKISSGKKVSQKEAKFLADFDPKLYALAINAAMLADKHGKNEESSQEIDTESYQEDAPAEDYAKELEELTNTFTETTLEVSFDVGVTLGEVSTITMEY